MAPFEAAAAWRQLPGERVRQRGRWVDIANDALQC